MFADKKSFNLDWMRKECRKVKENTKDIILHDVGKAVEDSIS